ncbi:MAG: hypothetical protein E5W38_08790 [Mesorhizobium sp.]|nr:MAG: hypothetical protein E5W38_08790 [Mesorhizobium sp.]TKB17079.1 MAG: hypothetical protein E5V75_12535 [Mesorhizobium sp.]
MTYVKAHLDRAGDHAECEELGSPAVLGRSYQIWQRDDRTARGSFGAIMLAFGLALFLLLTPSSQAQAHEFGASQGVSSTKIVPSVADSKVDGATSTASVLSVSALDEPGCHDSAVHANCGLCAGGHCFGSAAILAAAPGIGFVSGPDALAFLDQSGFALTKPDEAFRPPRSVP